MSSATLTRVLLIAALLAGAGVAVVLLSAPSDRAVIEAPVCVLPQSAEAPSGRVVELCQVLLEAQPSGDTWAVVRVIDPDLPDLPDQADHDWACATWGLPAARIDPPPTRIVVQIMAEPFARGEPAPGIAQSIEAYSIVDDTCRWELL